MKMTRFAVGVLAAVFAASGAVSAHASTGDANDHWAGFSVPLDLNADSSTFAAINGSFDIPKLHCRSKTESHVSNWVGFGGVDGASLPQIGVVSACVNGRQLNATWKEWFDPHAKSPEVQITKNTSGKAVPKMLPGDHIHIDLSRNLGPSVDWPATAKDEFAAEFLVQREDGGGLHLLWSDQEAVHRYSSKSTTSVGSSAECITEDPGTGKNGKLFPLAPFTAVHWSECTLDAGSSESDQQEIVLSTGGDETTRWNLVQPKVFVGINTLDGTGSWDAERATL